MGELKKKITKFDYDNEFNTRKEANIYRDFWLSNYGAGFHTEKDNKGKYNVLYDDPEMGIGW